MAAQRTASPLATQSRTVWVALVFDERDGSPRDGILGWMPVFKTDRAALKFCDRFGADVPVHSIGACELINSLPAAGQLALDV